MDNIQTSTSKPNTALKILVVEDNDELRELTLEFLQAQGHYVRGVALAEEVLEVSSGFVPNVYVIDLNLPDEDGLNLVRRLRSVQPHAGVVITTARTQIGDRVEGYESGADLYMPKPVSPLELLAGIHAVAKKFGVAKTLEDHSLRFDQIKVTISGPTGLAALTGAEAEVLVALARAPDFRLERWRLAEIIGIGSDTNSLATLEMRVTRLRKKLATAGAHAPYIRALHKQGYALCNPVYID